MQEAVKCIKTYKRSRLILVIAILLLISILFFATFFPASIREASLKWKYKTGGPVISSPIVENGVVYVGSSDGNIYALDAKTGKLIWRYATSGRIWSSPTYWKGAVYVGSSDNRLYALNAPTAN